MSLVDDQIINEGKYNALDELGKRINKARDIVSAISEVQRYNEALENGKKEAKDIGKSKSEEKVDTATLASDIMNDMGR